MGLLAAERADRGKVAHVAGERVHPAQAQDPCALGKLGRHFFDAGHSERRPKKSASNALRLQAEPGQDVGWKVELVIGNIQI